MIRLDSVRAAREAAGAGMWAVEKDKKGTRTLVQYREDGKTVKIATMHASVEADDFLCAAVNSIGFAATEIETLREAAAPEAQGMAAVKIMHQQAMERTAADAAADKRRGRIQLASLATVCGSGILIGWGIVNTAYSLGALNG